jgi:hypothetical protein
MMRLFPETCPEDSRDDETVFSRLTQRTARMMILFPETCPEDSKDDETVPGVPGHLL